MAAHCALCGVRDHAFGGRGRNGTFLLAIAILSDGNTIRWPRAGTAGWCGNPAGEIQWLTVVRIALSRTVLNEKRVLLCQQCIQTHTHHGDLFAVAA